MVGNTPCIILEDNVKGNFNIPRDNAVLSPVYLKLTSFSLLIFRYMTIKFFYKWHRMHFRRMGFISLIPMI